jgi:hypothetical protein
LKKEAGVGSRNVGGRGGGMQPTGRRGPPGARVRRRTRESAGGYA